MRFRKFNNLVGLVISLTITLVLIMACGSKPKAYKSGADGFSVMFPPGSEVTIPKIKNYSNGIEEIRHSVTSDKNSAYEVIVTKFPASILDSEDAKSVLEKAASMENGKIISKQETTFQGNPAVIIQTEFSGSTGTLYTKSVMFLVAAKYKLFAIRTAKKDQAALDSPEVNDFINSFKLE